MRLLDSSRMQYKRTLVTGIRKFGKPLHPHRHKLFRTSHEMKHLFFFLDVLLAALNNILFSDTVKFRFTVAKLSWGTDLKTLGTS